ncbi:putative Iojap-related protein [Legionella israelensis]|nr:Ribosomal silencing factor RsfS [Legionella israelensis]SCX92209.1 ribosome-associated protein [Legionella israelensis DSM 19235]STX58032.1 putative Iojap-related protein [Legionella israelensis]
MLNILLEALDDIQAFDVITLDVKKQTTITDYMVIASGRSSRHVKAIAEQVIEAMKKAGHQPLSFTGLDEGDWALVDFGDCILHVMQPDTRAFYNLEGLWQELP